MVYSDSLLHQVTKPARYTGGEWNSIIKDWQQTEVRMALAYPDLYEVGMSNLALPILYDLLNQEPGVLCERAFAPWVDIEKAMRESNLPLLSLETRHPLRDFDLIGFSLGYELTYTNVLNMLDLARIPVLATERDDSYPLIIAGGGCALNPEPMSDFIDLFVVGEGEEVLLELIRLFRTAKSQGLKKEEFLSQAAAIDGIYIPRFYQVNYCADGTVAQIYPAVPQAKPTIQRRILTKLPPPPTRPVVPHIEVVHDRAAIEIQRGCTRGCRFCQAGVIYRPVRQRSIVEVAKAASQLVKNCGYRELSLLSLSSTDYEGLKELVTILYRQLPWLTLSLPSLRLDAFSRELMGCFDSQKKLGLTFAPEAGTERLRQVINKSLPEEKILATLSQAAERGWTNFKLYFLVGLPTETMEDVEGIIKLVRQIRHLKGSPRIKATLSSFVPKSHTPFQWVAQQPHQELEAKCQLVRHGLRKLGVHLSWQEPKISWLEGIFSRGDRRLGKVIHHAWKLGCRFDAWSEHFDYNKWLRAFSESGLDPEFYASSRSLDKPLPWNHIDIGVETAFLKQEYQRTLEGKETPDCRYANCNHCGLQHLHPACKKKVAV